jgi:hypothetical protein
MGQYVDITEAGIALRPWHIRWATPAQLDEIAAAAGLSSSTGGRTGRRRPSTRRRRGPHLALSSGSGGAPTSP